MTEDEYQRRLQQIASQATVQMGGPYSAQSDAVSALSLIEKLAVLLIEDRRPETKTLGTSEMERRMSPGSIVNDEAGVGVADTHNRMIGVPSVVGIGPAASGSQIDREGRKGE